MHPWENRKEAVAATATGNFAAGSSATYKWVNNASARICLVSNNTGGLLLVRVNSTTPAATDDTDVASLTNYEEIIPNGMTVDLCRDGARLINALSIWFIASGASGAHQVWGVIA